MEPSKLCNVCALGCTVGVGHSHIFSMVEAQQVRLEQKQPLTAHFHWVLLQDKEFQPNVSIEDGRPVLNPALRERLLAELAALPKTPPFLCASLSGNEYYWFGQTEHPRRFDFSLPGRPDLGIRKGVEVIPSGLMRATMERSMGDALHLMSALRAAISIPIVFIQSPPPIPSDDYIRQNPGPFRQSIEQYGVTPANQRMKLWLLQSSIYQKACDDMGYLYLQTPEELTDCNGFLNEPEWHPDSVHATRWYGEHVLRKLDQLFAQTPSSGVLA